MERGFRDAVQIGSYVIAQVGGHYITAVNDQSGSERWRFESKSGSIRRMHDRGGWLLVEAENLVALDSLTGKERWSWPMSCYTGKSCNQSVRLIQEELILLTGFDGKDNNLMLLDAKTGQKQWPSWIAVNKARHVAVTPDLIAVATGVKPFAVVGLDRYTGRERWRFRPQGTVSAAAGLLADHSVVTTWWSSKTADEVYSVERKTGKPLYDWMVARRASSMDEARGGGPGFFYAYQPSVLGGGGNARAWNNRNGEKLWRKRIRVDFAPELRGGRMYVWTSKGTRATFIVYNALTGKEVWRYDRRGVDGHDETFQGGQLLIRMLGDLSFVATMDLSTGNVNGIGPLIEEDLHTAILRQSGKHLFALSGPKLIRLEPQTGTDLVFKFNQFVESGQVAEAKALHKELRPFVDELEAAATIHQRIVSRNFKQQAESMRSGSLTALLPMILRLSSDAVLVYYQDFRNFVVNVKTLLGPHDMKSKLKGKDLKRAAQICGRLIKLIIRFERKLDEADKGTIESLLQVILKLSTLLLESGAADEAHNTLYEVWSRAWMDRTDELVALTSRAVAGAVKKRLPAFEKAVAKNKGAAAALTEILTVRGLSLILDSVPPRDSAGEMTTEEFTEVLGRLRVALRSH